MAHAQGIAAPKKTHGYREQELRLLRLGAVLAKTGTRRTAHYERIAAGLMTPAVKIGPRASAWPASEVDEIIAWVIAGKSDDEIRGLVKQLVAARAK